MSSAPATDAGRSAPDPDEHPSESPGPSRGRGRIQLGQPVTLGSIDASRLILLAAAAAEAGSQDPVDVALWSQARALSGGQELTHPTVEAFEPAVPTRRVSVTHVSQLPSGAAHTPDGSGGIATSADSDVTILRGELRSVMTAAGLGPDGRNHLERNAGYMERRGWRPLAVASAQIHADGSAGPMEVHGFIPVRTARAKGFAPELTGQPEEWIRVPLWPATLRWLHWLNVLAIVALTVTGFYIAEPSVHTVLAGTQRTGYFMGDMRLIHYTVAWAWITLGVIRVYLMFFSRDRYVRWPTLWPLKNREDVVNMGRTLSAYLLMHPDEAPTYVAHNPLQQISYSAIYLMSGLQVITGLALYGLYNVHSDLWRWFEFPITWLGGPAILLIHYLIMLLFWVFVILHVYLVIRADTIDRNGGLSSMLSGGVWLRRRSHPVDDPSL